MPACPAGLPSEVARPFHFLICSLHAEREVGLQQLLAEWLCPSDPRRTSDGYSPGVAQTVWSQDPFTTPKVGTPKVLFSVRVLPAQCTLLEIRPEKVKDIY